MKTAEKARNGIWHHLGWQSDKQGLMKHFKNWNHSSPQAQWTIVDLWLVYVFVQHVWTKAVTSHLFTPLFMVIHLPLIHFAPPPHLLIDFKNSKWLTYLITGMHNNNSYCFSHLIGLYCHMIITLIINWLGFLLTFCFSLTKGQRSKCQTLLSVSAVHQPFHISI